LFEKPKMRLKLLCSSRVGNFVFSQLDKLGMKYYKMIEYKRDLDEEIPATQPKVPVHIKRLTPEHLKGPFFDGTKLGTHHKPVIIDEVQKRLKKGEVEIFAAFVEEDFAGRVWILMEGKKYQKEIELQVGVNKDEKLIYRVKVLPEYRKLGIGKKLLETSLYFLRNEDYRRAKTYVSIFNIPSIKIKEGLNFYPTKIFKFKRLFNNKKRTIINIDGNQNHNSSKYIGSSKKRFRD